MLEWYFKPLDPDYPDDVTLAQKNFRRESTGLPEIFIRELIQNVLDARRDGLTEPAKISIRLLNSTNGLNRTKLESILKPLEKHLTAAEHHEVREYSDPTALVVEEYGTKGLTGKTDDSRAKGTGQRWANFWHGEGKRSKRGRDLGRAGQGKITYHMMSAAQTLLAFTVRGGDEEPQSCVFGKCIVQKSHEVGSTHYMRHGYWRTTNDAVPKQPLPETSASFINDFRETFKLERTIQQGTSWIIPFPLPSATKDALITAVLKDFHFSIMKGALEVEVCGVKIDTTSVDHLIQKHVKETTLSSSFVAFLREVAKKEPSLKAASDWSFDGEQISEKSFSEEELKELQEKLEGGSVVAVRFPLELQKRSGSILKTSFDVYLQKPEVLHRTEELYIRSDLIIGDEKWLKDVPGKALGAVLAYDEPISEFLGFAEEASHLRWNAAEEELQSLYESSHARNALAKVRRSLPRLFRTLTGKATGIDEAALLHILSIPDTGEGQKKDKTKKKDKKPTDTPKPPDDIPAARPKPFRIADTKGGIRLIPGDLPLRKGQTARLEVAYARQTGDGDAFDNYHPFDFDLADESLIEVCAVRGISIDDQNENVVDFTIEGPDFELCITGFSESQRVVCRVITDR
jgi:hypothetical protein